MEDFVEQLSRGNVEEVKVVLASIVAALAMYQVLLMAVGYGKLRLPFLASRPASSTHRGGGRHDSRHHLAHWVHVHLLLRLRGRRL